MGKGCNGRAVVWCAGVGSLPGPFEGFVTLLYEGVHTSPKE